MRRNKLNNELNNHIEVVKQTLKNLIMEADNKVEAILIRQTSIGTVNKYFVIDSKHNRLKSIDSYLNELNIFPKNRKADGIYSYNQFSISGVFKMKLDLNVNIHFNE